jgi:hypothetical protein
VNVETHVETLRKIPCTQGVSRDKEMVENYLPTVDLIGKVAERFNRHTANRPRMLKQEIGTVSTVWDHLHETAKARLAAAPDRKPVIEAAYEAAPREWRAFTFQHSTRGPNLADKEVVAEMLASYTAGRLAFFFIEIGETPGPNEDADGNSDKLADLPHPVRAVFDRDMNALALDCDGYVVWDEPVKAITCDDTITIEPGGAPLEVGYMPSGKAAYGLRNTGLARWPYGSTEIIVALPVPPRIPSKSTT